MKALKQLPHLIHRKKLPASEAEARLVACTQRFEDYGDRVFAHLHAFGADGAGGPS
ncbi:hypothetical protein ABZY09_35205 [Streptomyces sp. NPDC002928]|uniref:hypothetical protein n=1 Tax=Streptomyces sp. NPDC002928 TaxID=3154440 RepID=UPI0033BAACC7